MSKIHSAKWFSTMRSARRLLKANKTTRNRVRDKGVVVTTNPLMIYHNGDTTVEVPAYAVAGYEPVVGDVVKVDNEDGMLVIDDKYVAVPTGPVSQSAAIAPGYESIDRAIASASLALVSGQATVVAVYIPAGTVLTKLAWMSGATAGASITHQWLSISDSTFHQLATTADQGTTAIAANAPYSWPLTATASGAASSYTIPASGLYYITLEVTASTMPSVASAPTAVAVLSETPRRTFFASPTGTPPAFPTTLVPTTTPTAVPYMRAA